MYKCFVIFPKIGMSRVHNTLLVSSLKKCFYATLNSYWVDFYIVLKLPKRPEN